MQSAALACLFLASAAALQLSSPPQLRPLRTRAIRLQADEPETDAKTDEEGAALAAAFKARFATVEVSSCSGETLPNCIGLGAVPWSFFCNCCVGNR